MERCPTCGARYRGGESCYRCQTDLRQVLAVEAAAGYHRHQALLALQRNSLPEARAHADRAGAIHRSPESVQVMALAALAERRFPEALARWREYRQRWQHGAAQEENLW